MPYKDVQSLSPYDNLVFEFDNGDHYRVRFETNSGFLVFKNYHLASSFRYDRNYPQDKILEQLDGNFTHVLQVAMLYTRQPNHGVDHTYSVKNYRGFQVLLERNGKRLYFRQGVIQHPETVPIGVSIDLSFDTHEEW